MIPPRPTVIKVGGSLFDWPELPRRMSEFLGDRRIFGRQERRILVAGGGAAADMIRSIDEIHALGDATSHRLALHAMDLTAIVLARLLPGTIAVDTANAAQTAWSNGQIPVVAPRRMLDEIEQSGCETLPASWEVTSDSIAAWLAIQVAADRLILIKSASLPIQTGRLEAARLGLVDPMLPVVARALSRVEYLNLREQASRPQLLK